VIRLPWRRLWALTSLPLWLVACGGEPVDPVDEAACRAMLSEPDSLEADEWLKATSTLPKRPGAMTPDAALGLVSKLQLAGATRVVAVKVQKLRAPEPCEYAAGVVVELPAEAERRLPVFKLYDKQTRNAGVLPRGDENQKYLYVPFTPSSVDDR
jgi:hypothetical protein